MGVSRWRNALPRSAAKRTCCLRAAIYSLSHWSKSSKANASSGLNSSPYGWRIKNRGADKLTKWLSGKPRSATIVALRDTELARLPRQAFEQLMLSHPLGLLRISQLMVQRLDSSQRQTRGALRAPT